MASMLMPLSPPANQTPSREIELLLCCAAPHIGAERLPRIRALLREPVDWGALIAAAVSQDVLPLVYHNLTVFGAAIPEGMKASLDHYLERNAARYAGLAQELVRVFQLLEARGIAALPFKGCVLAAAAYADPTHREFQDLDFLIRRRDALRAKDVLASAGYRLETGVKLNGLPAHGYEYRFLRGRDAPAVELCWRVTLRHSFASVDLSRLSGGVTIALAGGVVPTLGPEEQLLLLCLHGSKHVWGLLRWICDVAAVVYRYPELDWERLRRQARRVGCWRAVALGLHLAHELLGASLPAPMLEAIARAPGIAQAAGMVGEHLFRGDGGVSPETETRFHRYLAERFRDRLWIRLFPLVHLLYDLITPSERDRAALRLPAGLTPLYYALRPVRLLLHYGGAPVRKVLFRD
jgi:Uncharacterised nucleotidyltransferase